MGPSFQFHKGTIRTFAVQLTEGEIFGFQFHKGTIRTPPGCKRAIKRAISIP